MEASVRIFKSSNRHFNNSLFLLTKLHLEPYSYTQPPLSLRYRSIRLPPLSVSPSNFLRISSSDSLVPGSCKLRFPHSLSASQTLDSLFFSNRFARILSGHKDCSFNWHFASEDCNERENSIARKEGPLVTVVLLGWLGAKPKHLRRYIDLYNSRGIHAVTFVASVRDVLSLDLGKKLEERIAELARELVSWLSESEKDGRERFLIFHTFSNTGWLAYGAILVNLQNRKDVLNKIKGCVIDSGGDPNIDPKVWAAGFTAALLKKWSSSAYPSIEARDGTEVGNGETELKIEEKEPLLIETFLLSAFEKLFSFLLNLPDVNQRLSKVISVLRKNQPDCPQLYLYSTADKVIPFQSVESFIDEQTMIGKNVRSFNFSSSPHVDHYRTFPKVYASGLQNFVEECLVSVKIL